MRFWQVQCSSLRRRRVLTRRGRTRKVEAGRRLFFDVRLSEPPGTSCASCHDPARAFSGDNGSGLAVARGSRPETRGTRNAPTLMYLATSPGPGFSEKDGKTVPSGGFFWDGRARTLAEQALGPLFTAHEMNNRDATTLAAKVAASDAAPCCGRLSVRMCLPNPIARCRRLPLAGRL